MLRASAVVEIKGAGIFVRLNDAKETNYRENGVKGQLLRMWM